MAAGVGRVVIDNLLEIDALAEAASAAGRRQVVLIRITPDVDPHTHSHLTTGVLDSKFGFPLVTAEEAVTTAMSAPNVDLLGLHFHIGSLITESEPYLQAIEFILDFAAEMKRKHGFELKELAIGGGYGVPTDESREAIELAARTEAIFLDPTYTAKAMAGLIAYVRQQRLVHGQTVLFWHTGGQVGLFA